MDKVDKLVKQAQTIAKKHLQGHIKMSYQKETIGTYDLPYDGSIDMKSPESWVRGNVCFEIKLRDKDVNKVELKYCEE
jgi:hypothetical protein